ncbi:hypothetical protein BJ138DRAFT_1146577 [Hygrophoropsis aurantiaca]|uniref:Uncharacterized protein n=1 Tax=Hygrophoropsis aurantiaca TaxID=72124 RepID=A0ACB8AKB7_9AGAM|nr:hypothetical protein BJ138DRAFT_1146577 [Hygrophoropsis aurantiaca]
MLRSARATLLALMQNVSVFVIRLALNVFSSNHLRSSAIHALYYFDEYAIDALFLSGLGVYPPSFKTCDPMDD